MLRDRKSDGLLCLMIFVNPLCLKEKYFDIVYYFFFCQHSSQNFENMS
jgi:hypothetical protein